MQFISVALYCFVCYGQINVLPQEKKNLIDGRNNVSRCSVDCIKRKSCMRRRSLHITVTTVAVSNVESLLIAAFSSARRANSIQAVKISPSIPLSR